MVGGRFIGLYLLYSGLGLYFENVLPDAMVPPPPLTHLLRAPAGAVC